jgi:hypothetical protein
MNNLIHNLDVLTHELRRVALLTLVTTKSPVPDEWTDRAEELYATAAEIDAWIAELIETEETA